MTFTLRAMTSLPQRSPPRLVGGGDLIGRLQLCGVFTGVGAGAGAGVSRMGLDSSRWRSEPLRTMFDTDRVRRY